MFARAALIVCIGICITTLVRAAPPGWQTYQSARYGYEIDYPNEFEILATGLEHERDGRTFRVLRRHFAAPVPTLDVEVFPHPAVEPAEVATAGAFAQTVTRAPIELDGRTGTESVYRFANGQLARVVVDLGDVRFTFSASSGTPDLRATPWWRVIQSFRLRR